MSGNEKFSHEFEGRGNKEIAHQIDVSPTCNKHILTGTYTETLSGFSARHSDNDLAETLRISTRAGMKTFMIDFHIAAARNKFLTSSKGEVRNHIHSAEELVRETSYHRRRTEILEITKAIDHTSV